jgi:hypothetical protein
MAARKTAPKEETAAKASKAKRAAKPPEQPEAPQMATVAKCPVKMTDALFERILERVADGAMLMQLEKEPDFPSRRAILNWVNASPDRREQYELARRDQADYCEELLAEVNEKLLTNKIDPASARALSDNLKWAAKVGRPERYGDRSQVDLNVSRSDAPATAEELRVRILKTIGKLPMLPEAVDAEN